MGSRSTRRGNRQEILMGQATSSIKQLSAVDEDDISVIRQRLQLLKNKRSSQHQILAPIDKSLLTNQTRVSTTSTSYPHLLPQNNDTNAIQIRDFGLSSSQPRVGLQARQVIPVNQIFAPPQPQAQLSIAVSPNFLAFQANTQSSPISLRYDNRSP